MMTKKYLAWLSDFNLGVSALRRDWHSGELRLLISALVLAVAAVSSVGFLADRVGRALDRNSAQMLGGDLALQTDTPVPEAYIQRAHSYRLETARTVQFASMVSSANGSQLASLKAVSPGYPLRGALRVASATSGIAAVSPNDGPDSGTAWVDAQLLNLLGLDLGSTIQVGDAKMEITRLITYEPDRGIQFINVAPRVMIRIEDLPGTGLIAPGSRVSYRLLAAGPASAVAAYKAWLTPQLKRGQKLESLESARPEMQRVLARADQFLVLVALLTVMVAAVAIALAARRFSLRHQDGIAIMRCLGATQSQLGAMLWVEFLLLAFASAAAGVAIGYGVHLALVSIAAAWLDATLPPPSWLPAQHGFATGLLLLLGFALPPLSVLRRISPARVLRRAAAQRRGHRWAAYGVGLLAFFALALWISGDLRLSIAVCAGFLLALLCFSLLAYGAIGGLSHWRRRLFDYPVLRYALAGIARRKGLAVTQVCALAIGIMILLLLTITRTDLLAGWQNTLPSDAPNTFLINIQPDQYEHVRRRLRQAGLGTADLIPMVRGRLLSINQRAVDADSYTDERAKRLAEREFNLSYMSRMPQSNSVQTGRWLDPDKPEVSIESGIAATLGIALGDTLQFEVAGHPVVVKVTGTRDVKWDSFEANFFAILSPAALKDAPATYITAFYLPASRAGLMSELVHDFPNLTVFDVGAIMAQVQQILGQVITAVQLLFIFTVFAGILVLGAAFFATRDERIHEIAILRTLGASARQLRDTLRVELFLVGTIAGLLAASGAVAMAWVLADQIFGFTLSLTWWPWLAGMVAGVVTAGAGGSIALNGILKTPPLVSLRGIA